MPDAIELLVLCIHAGRSPTQAVDELARRAPPAVRSGFVAVERKRHRGHGLADALTELPAVLGPRARELAATVATADREGLPLAPMLDQLAAEARAARRRQGEAAARRLPVTLSFPLVTCILPAFVLLALAPAVLGAISTLRTTAP
jgi:tight adherence protein C